MHQKHIAYYGLLSALALLMGYIELMLPMPIAVPGIKLGLANVVVLLALYQLGTSGAFFISLVRIILAGLLFQGFGGFLYSLSGAVLSFLVMVLAKEVFKLSVVGVSILGGVFHNVGQIAVAAWVVENTKLFYYLPVLLVSGVLTGLVIGMVTNYTLPYLKRN